MEWLQGIRSKDQFLEILAEESIDGRYIDEENDSASLEDESCESNFQSALLKDWKVTLVESEREWVVADLIPAKSLTLISAPPKTGKSTWAFAMAKAVTTGESFMGHSVKQCPVQILALEEMDVDVMLRTKEMGFNDENTYICNKPLKADEDTLKAIGEFVEEKKIGLIIVDCLTRFWDLDDENNASEVNKAIKPILKLARSKEVAIVLIHHTRKTEGMFGKDIRGSADLFAQVDNAFNINRYSADPNDHRRILESNGRYREISKQTVIELKANQYLDLGTKDHVGNRDIEDRILTAIAARSMDAKEISAFTAIKEGTVRTICEKLLKDREVIRTGGGIRGNPHKYSKAQNDSAEGGSYSSGTNSTTAPQIIDKSIATEQYQSYSPHKPIDPPNQGVQS